MNGARVVFVNHACFQVVTPRFSLLTDPWFSGGVFNDSWRLLRETDPGGLDLSGLKYLWISHEHPDHLHFPTLKLLIQKAKSPLTVFFQNLPDKSVKNELSRLGYSVVELKGGAAREVEPGFTIRCFPSGSDSALVIDAFGVKIVNANDCALSPRQLERIREACGPAGPDLLFTQFGLAGYYANQDDEDGLRKAHRFHLDQLLRYQTALKARYVVPFASFVYFCRRSNSYLNRAQVRPKEVAALELEKGEILFPGPLQEVWPLPAEAGAFTAANAGYWEGVFDEERRLAEDPAASPREIEKYGAAFMSEFKRAIFQRRAVDETVVFLPDIKKAAVFDWRAYSFRLRDSAGLPEDAVGEVDSGDFLSFLKFPWGADTLNITSVFRVHSLDLWQRLVWTKHYLYSIKKAGLRTRLRNKLLLLARDACALAGIDLCACGLSFIPGRRTASRS